MDIERLAPKRKDRLGEGIARHHNRCGGRFSFCEKDHRIFPFFRSIAKVEFGVAQFGDFKRDFLLFFFRFFFNSGELFSQLFVKEDPLDDLFARLFVFIEKILNGIFDFLNDRSPDLAIGELVFCLGFKDGIFDFDEDRSDDPFAHIDPLKVLFRVFIDPFQESLLEKQRDGFRHLAYIVH